jgi:hypothetical protein
MNIYLVTRTDEADYDEYDAMVVIAESEARAVKIHPDGNGRTDGKFWVNDSATLKVELIGIAKDDEKECVVLSSFHAG